MNAVDSSAWLSYFAGDRNARTFARPIRDTRRLIVPTVCVYEVFKVIARERDEHVAFAAVAMMRQGTVVNLTESIALTAASMSLATRRAMADSLVLATARLHGATLWTQDADFDGLEQVRYLKPASS